MSPSSTILCCSFHNFVPSSFIAENEFGSTFTYSIAGGGNITIKQNNTFNIGLYTFTRSNKTKEIHVVSMCLPVSRLFRFYQDINHGFRSVVYQVILKKQYFQYNSKI